MRLALILIGALAWADLLILLTMGMTLDKIGRRVSFVAAHDAVICHACLTIRAADDR